MFLPWIADKYGRRLAIALVGSLVRTRFMHSFFHRL